MPQPQLGLAHNLNRRGFIGGSDARTIMGTDEAALVQLWREKRGEAQPEDLSEVLMVQLGTVTEDLNRRWYERHTGNAVRNVQRRIQHSVHKWMAATLDGRVAPGGAVFEAKFMLPWTFSEEAAAEKHMAQLQHNMWVANAQSAVLSIITGGGKWVNIGVNTDPLYQHLLLTAEKKFWRCVMSGEEPRLFGVRYVPEASITARAVSSSTPSAVRTRSRNGVCARPVVRVRSMPSRVMSVTSTPRRVRPAIAGSAASGARNFSTSSPPVGRESAGGSTQPGRTWLVGLPRNWIRPRSGLIQCNPSSLSA